MMNGQSAAGQSVQAASSGLSKQYVWALGDGARQYAVGDRVNDRYEVVAPCIWCDLTPDQLPELPTTVPTFAQPYLQAYPDRLHLPGIYGVCRPADGPTLLLLDNVPVDRGGKLLPTLHQAWAGATAFRQAYWCAQLLDLWRSLGKLGVAASLLKGSNLRVEGWRVRLIAFVSEPAQPSLDDLSVVWSTLIDGAQSGFQSDLRSLCEQMATEGADLEVLTEQMNRALLAQATGLSMKLTVAGNTHPGPGQSRNEDACYPSQSEFQRTRTDDLPALPRIAIVCDGIGGHEGGEIASQTVVRSLQLQLRSLLAEAAEQTEPMSPDLVTEQIEAAIRVANNLVAAQNDQQGRDQRQRMGTTLVAAVQIPQRIPKGEGDWHEVNELYLAHVGDSRAYWITPEYCHALTVDDDVAGREVAAGRSLLAAARQRSDGASLSQAMGTRAAERLTPHVQRFILDEEGVLLLCSDGLSDNRRVEMGWANYIGLIVKNIVSLPAAVESWIELANQKNGHDNVAVVLMHCQIGGHQATNRITSLVAQPDQLPTEMTPASRALLYGEAEEETVAAVPVPEEDGQPQPPQRPIGVFILAALSVSALLLAGLFLWFNLRVDPGNRPSEPAPERLEEVPTEPEPRLNE
ncbi:MAG: protein phosphatase 2C domain-containing protein [Cyanobacteria bacterium P01_A01_bin.105]